MDDQFYMTRRIMITLPHNLQNKMWQMVLRREQANAEDYLHIFHIRFQNQYGVITHSQEVPIFKCTAEIEYKSDDTNEYKIYVIRDEVPGERAIYTMLFADEY